MLGNSGAQQGLDEQVDDLRERMRLLQGDRKANIDILEANKNSNKDLIRELREENKELRKKLATVQRGGLADGGESPELEQVRSQLNRLRKTHDDLKNRATEHKRNLTDLKDQVKDLELEARRPNQEDSPLTRKIRMLENRLDKAMIKYNEAQSIRKTYEQIVKRLKEERVGFDNQLAAIERTLAAKQRDYEELLLLSGDANHAREVAQQELERVRGGYEEERRKREQELRERHQLVQVRQNMNKRMEKREKMRQEILQKESGDMNEEEEQAMKQSLAVNVMSKGKLKEDRREHRSKIDVFESAFRKIKEATGVSDVNEVIQKIVSQEGTTENLLLLTRENQTKIEALNEHKARLKARVEEIKYSGPGGGHRRKMVDDHEEQLTASATRLERCRLKFERLARMLISVKAGIEHLSDKLETVREEVGGQSIEMTDETIVDVMLVCEQTILELMNRIKADNAEQSLVTGVAVAAGGKGTSSRAAAAAAKEEEKDVRPLSALSDSEVMQTRPFNQRIELPSMEEGQGEWTIGDHGADEAVPADVDEEELTREKVKKASTQILMAQDKKKKKPRRRHGGGDDDDRPRRR